MRRGLIGALVALGVATPAHAAVTGPGCQPARPAIAHGGGGKALSPQPAGAPVPCLTTAGPTTDSATVAVTPSGTVLYAPIETPQGNGVPAPANIVVPTAVARSTDAGAHWTDVLPVDDPADTAHQHTGIIPWLYADPTTGRIWYATPNPCGAMVSFSDDDGLTWKDADQVGCPGQGGMSVFEGPAPASGLQPSGYPHVVYYCANLQDNGPHLMYCFKSLDGGSTWNQVGSFPNATPPPSCQDSLDGPRGRGVAPDGTVYFVVDRCDEGLALATSHDEGDTWRQTPLTPTPTDSMPITSLAIDSAGRLFVAYTKAADELPYLISSSDAGVHWSAPQMIGAPGVNTIDPRTLSIAVSPTGRVAVDYTGSTDGGKTWNGYLAASDDALSPGATWWSATVNDPAKPLQAGSPGAVFGDREWFSTVQFDRGDTPWAGFQCVRTASCPSGRFGLVGRLVFPAPAACRQRRVLRVPRADGRVVRLTLAVDGLVVRRRHGHRLRSVAIPRLAAGPHRMRLTLWTARGHRHVVTRTVAGCP